MAKAPQAGSGQQHHHRPSPPLPRRRNHTDGGATEKTQRAVRLTASDVLTVAEVAELLHVPESTVGDWARRRVIPSMKLGRRRIFIRSKIESLLLADDEPTASPYSRGGSEADVRVKP